MTEYINFLIYDLLPKATDQSYEPILTCQGFKFKVLLALQ